MTITLPFRPGPRADALHDMPSAFVRVADAHRASRAVLGAWDPRAGRVARAAAKARVMFRRLRARLARSGISVEHAWNV